MKAAFHSGEAFRQQVEPVRQKKRIDAKLEVRTELEMD